MLKNYEYHHQVPASPNSVNRVNQLDAEFDQNLASMKKFILELKDRKCRFYNLVFKLFLCFLLLMSFISFIAKQLCAVWIKKMCNVTDSGNVIPKHIRNSYSLRLLEILRNGENFDSPFDEKPPPGPLATLVSLKSFRFRK